MLALERTVLHCVAVLFMIVSVGAARRVGPLQLVPVGVWTVIAILRDAVRLCCWGIVRP